MTDTAAARARRFVILLGWVSLFADLCYEGMRGAVGPYLEALGESAAAVGFVAGAGEALGYGLRYVTGALADRTKRYWALTIAGYLPNLVAVPLLALAGSWPAVAGLVALERLGKAIRSPAKSTLASFAAKDLGAGKTFAIQEAMDQTGAVLGPLAFAAILAWRGGGLAGYRAGFVALAVPAVIVIALLLRARRLYPDPRQLEPAVQTDAPLGPRYAIYLVGVALVAFGLVDWPLLAYHLKAAHVVSADWALIASYSIAMAADGAAALLAGWLFDRSRSPARVVAVTVALGAGYAPLVLGASSSLPWLAIPGVALWALARSSTESIGKALIATLVPAGQRGRAYGLYYLVWGIAWWGGSVAFGWLYGIDPEYASIAMVTALLCGAAVVALSARHTRPTSPNKSR
ncbi:MAG TPA: MFS transporter [Kofleriaceae bacterium]